MEYPDIDEPFFRWICAILSQEQKRDRMFLLPRGHLKTSLCVIANIARRITINPNWRFLIVSATSTIAEKRLLAIENIIQNNRKFNELWPEIRPEDLRSTQWSREGFVVNRDAILIDPTCEGRGIGNNVTGSHYDFIVFDDIVTKDNCDTSLNRDRLRDGFTQAFYLLDPGGKVDVLGTRYDGDDIYGDIIKDRQSWDIYQEKVLHLNSCDPSLFNKECGCGPTDISKPHYFIFPGKFNDMEFKRRKRLERDDDYVISCQFFNNPVSKATQIFKPEYINEFVNLVTEKKATDGINETIEKIPYSFFLGVDPAAGKRADADLSAFVVIAIGPDGKRYVMETLQGKMQFSQIVDETWTFHKKYNPRLILVETQVAFIGLQEAFANYMTATGNIMPIQYVKSPTVSGAKDQRIRAMEPAFRAGMVCLRSNQTELRDQLIGYPRVGHDDLIDALSWAMSYAVIPDVEDNYDEELDEEDYIPMFRKAGY